MVGLVFVYCRKRVRFQINVTSVYEVSMKVCLLLLILTTESSGGQITEAVKKVLTNVFII